MNIKYDKIGFRLAKRRKKLKYTQPQLAEIVGIPDYLLLGTIRDTPSEDFIDLIKLCDDYEISILYDTANSLINNRNNR